MELYKKRTWITGASSGIGAATARLLAKKGSEVVLSARRINRLNELAEEIKSQDGKAIVKALNVSDRKAVEQLGEELEDMGGVDILVNNAGLMPLAPMLEGRVDEWEKIIDVNIKGVLYAINAVLPGMAKRKKGHIVNLGSVAGRVTFQGSAVYCGSKFAVRAISDTLRKEATNYGVRVTDIQPGSVATELADSIGFEPARKAVTSMQGFYGPGKEILQAEDIASAILYAVTQPDRVNVCEVLVRPKIQEF